MNATALNCAGPRIGAEQMLLLMQRLRTHAGIKIESPQQVIEAHIRERMSLLDIADMEDYLKIFDASISARAEWLALVDLLTVKETRFFRQPEAFECVAQHIRELVDLGPTPAEISFWSAGCATGQELYSIAMVVEHIVRQYQPWLQWHGIGTDISFQAISTAQEAIYPHTALEFIPQAYRFDHMQIVKQGKWQVSADIRARTHFFHSNLLHANNIPFADFNIVFCQNVLIYFERDRQRWIIDQLVKRLRPGGLLILGAGEDVLWLNSSMRRVSCPGVCAYRKIGG
jgi:type IV pilus assembly protein PilK